MINTIYIIAPWQWATGWKKRTPSLIPRFQGRDHCYDRLSGTLLVALVAARTMKDELASKKHPTTISIIHDHWMNY